MRVSGMKSPVYPTPLNEAWSLRRPPTRSIKIEGIARFANLQEPGKLKVRFNRFPANLFEGDYWILDLNPDYTRALVGSPNRKFLWLLSKNPNDQKLDFKEFIQKANELNFQTEPLYFNPKRIK
jgi:lipocalin